MMGEARRKRLATAQLRAEQRRAEQKTQAEPIQDEPVQDNAAEEGLTSVHEFRVADGMVGLTLDVRGVPPCTLSIPAEELTAILADLDLSLRTIPYSKLVTDIARRFRDGMRKNDKDVIRAVGMAALWTTFHHPKANNEMEREISDLLRETGKAHITWHLGLDGLAMALGGGFLDLEATAAMVKQHHGEALLVEFNDPDRPKTPQN